MKYVKPKHENVQLTKPIPLEISFIGKLTQSVCFTEVITGTYPAFKKLNPLTNQSIIVYSNKKKPEK
jgi:hypothetical protein